MMNTWRRDYCVIGPQQNPDVIASACPEKHFSPRLLQRQSYFRNGSVATVQCVVTVTGLYA